MVLKRSLAVVLTSLLTTLVACGPDDPERSTRRSTDIPTTEDAGSKATEPAAVPFEAVGPSVYVPKVKNLLTGVAATDEEVKAVVADPNALRGLIDTWMTLPSFETRMLDFFRNAFQQDQVTPGALMTNLNVRFSYNEAVTGPLLARNVMDSFPLTVWKLVQEQRPFTETLTTRRYMMTTAMMSALSFFDDHHVADNARIVSRLAQRNALSTYAFDTKSTATTDESLNPAGASFMKFRFPGVQPAGCAPTLQTFNATGDLAFYTRLMGMLMGKTTFNPCATTTPPPEVRFDPLYRESDWSDWHWVTLRTDPVAPGASPAFYELSKLRTATEMTLHTDRVGFFGTLAFAANWGTNITNEARVTANQALIVALGQSIAGEGAIQTFPLSASNASHASDPACIGCHAQLDPLKQFFRQSYTLWYSQQTDSAVIDMPAGFSLGGVTKAGKGVGDLAGVLASHPRFPVAWVGKLHFWASSTPVIEDDPEVVRIAGAFAAADFDFKTLVRELFSSPLITWAAGTRTTQTNGVIVSIARRDQFCASLSNRLGLPDVCGSLAIKPTPAQRTISQRALLMPTDTYYRSFALPSLPTSPDLFFRQSTESICRLVADQVIDVKGGTSKYSSAEAPLAITDFVGNVMALVPSDPKFEQAKAILTDNFAESTKGGATPTDALKATFTLACLAPSSVVVGL